MKRAKFILDLVNKKVDAGNEELAALEDTEATKTIEIEELFQDQNLYESAPPSAVFSPNRAIPPIQLSYSAPLLGEPEEVHLDDELEAPLEKVQKIVVEEQEPALPKSPYSIISGVGPLDSSSVHDFSDSSVSWYPDSEEDRRIKKLKHVFVRSDTSSSDISDLEYHTEINQLGPSKVISSVDSACEKIDENVDRPEPPKEPVRWKKSDPSKWKKNLAKSNRHACLPYQGKKGNKMPAKKPKPVKCMVKCRYQCTDKFSEEERLEVCGLYWKIKDFVAQKQFLLYHITSMPIKTLKAGIPNEKHRSAAYAYYFEKNDEKHRVCKDFFLKTLCISNGPVIEALKHKNELGAYMGKDGRGSRDPINKTDPESEQKIIDHINSFPRLESHYCRKSSKRQYLDSKLTIAKMYELYKDKLTSAGDKPCSFYVYKRIFGSKFNLSFFVPKKDLCIICTRYDSAGRPDHLKEDYEAHIAKKNAAQETKELDKQRSIQDDTYLVVTADMQSTLHIPVCGVGILFYTRKLNVQNYTIHTAKPPHDAYCITWSEVNGKRGSIEIASAMNYWITKLPSSIKEVTIYSDTCAGQNRNQYITAFLMHLIQRADVSLEVLELKYLESGHTHMEVDSMHSAIEREQRHTSVYSMIDWRSIMGRARSKRHRESAPPYVVKELTYNEMLDVKVLNEKFARNTSYDTNGEKITWLKIKCLRFEKQHPGLVKFRYSHDGAYLEFDMQLSRENAAPKSLRRTNRRKIQDPACDVNDTKEEWITQLKAYHIPQAYTTPLPISEAKKKDLIGLCNKGIIPDELHSWYRSLPTSTEAVDRLCQPDVTEESEE